LCDSARLNEFDYIVVGGGTAGCVVAARLTESGKHRVLLLEAGGSDDRFFVRMPIGYGKCFYDARLNWMYRSEPEAALNDRNGYWPRGKLLGGSGSINAMVYVRGLRQDYDDWATLGNPGWAWNDVQPYFEKIQTRTTDISADAHPLCRAFIAAGEELGVPRNDDFNGDDAEGVGYYRIAMHDGVRESSATAWEILGQRLFRQFEFLRHPLRRPHRLPGPHRSLSASTLASCRAG